MSRLPAVLVLSGGGFQGLAVVRLLSEADSFRIVVADTQAVGVTTPFVDRLLRLPPVAERRLFDDALRSTCRAEDVRLILASTDHELTALSEIGPSLEATGVGVPVCEPRILTRLRDKKVVNEDLAAAGLPVLPVLAALAPTRGTYPIIGKPRHGWGGVGVVVAHSAGDMERLTPETRAALIWQPFLEDAEEVSVDFAILRTGEVPGVGLRQRIRTSGGFAVVSDTIADDEIERHARRFASWVAGLGGRGLFNLQFLRQDDVLVISDVNPRLGTSAVHWRGSGFNPVLALCADAGVASSGVGIVQPSAPFRTVRHLEEHVFPVAPASIPIDGVVFDLDDTLIPTKRFIRDRLDLALRSMLDGAEWEGAYREGVRIIEEGPRNRLLDTLSDTLGWSNERRSELQDAYGSTWPARCATHSDVFPALDALRRRGLRLGLLTDNPPETQRRKLEASGLLPFFDAVVFARESGAEKPDSRAFARVAEALGLSPGRLAMAGDNPHRDLVGASQAGYGRLFLLQRSGACSSFDLALATGLPGADRFEPVANLRQLIARLAPPID